MRNTIRQRLSADIPALGGRVLEPHDDYASADKPYLVLQQGWETGSGSGFPGFRKRYEVWLHEAKAAGFDAVDRLAESVIRSLDERTMTDPDTGDAFFCRYIGTIGRDRVDGERQTLSRILRFAVDAVQPAALAETVPDDPWLEAIAAWTRALLGGSWQVCLNEWPSSYLRPAVLWRLGGMETGPGNAAALVVRKRLVGHVAGRTDNEEREAAALLASSLKLDGKVVLSAADRRWLAVEESGIDFGADPIAEGQLTVALSRRVKRESFAEDAPLMREVFFNEIGS
ncbi:hypothetical protein [Cohnella massiliensis]|uniref:hypothetical protein n=1 Tax=Cohnella massiliensis TaxID=1816691 RepID=UPI001119C60A|nr:hypothetical protein [Cohnella massiliensis]